MEFPRKPGSAKRDLVVVGAAVVTLFVLGGYFELAERWHAYSIAHEDWELDELVLVIAFSTVGFGWYAYRRWREWAGEAAHRTEVNSALAAEIAKRQETESALRESEARYRTIFNTTSAGIGRASVDDGRIMLANGRLAELFGYDDAEAFSSGFRMSKPYIGQECLDQLFEGLDPEHGITIDGDFSRKDGSTIALQLHVTANIGSSAIDFIAIDITEKTRAEEAIAESARLARHRDELAELVAERTSELLTIADNLPVLIARIDRNQRFTFLNATAERWYDVMARKAVGRPLRDLFGEESYQKYRPMIESSLAGRQMRFERTATYPDGVERIVDVTLVPDMDRNGVVQGIFSLTVDISERKRAELALQESEQRFRDFTDASADWYWETDSDGIFTFVSPDLETATGVPVDSVLGKSRWEISINQDGNEKAWQEHLETLANRQPFRDFRSVRVNARGEEKWVTASGISRFDEDGNFLGYRGTGRDISGLVETEQALKQSAERLSQAQKMEAVGQLTGGVAHDFNNLLMVIQGNAEMLTSRVAGNESLTNPIIRATQRGAELTQRLLAFSRRQPLRPEVIHLGELVEGMSDLLTRTLGETVEIVTSTEPGLWSATADPGQVESALLNLALNARDAMPDGGRLTIKCTNLDLDNIYSSEITEVEPGDYVVLSVTDEGSGMSADVRERAFEPFFTTKEVGKGSGLGLSMVYGFAKQSGGHAVIYSEEGMGTTTSLYLPRAAVETQVANARTNGGAPQGRGELILVIEDDEDVRSLAVHMVQSLGYDVVDAADIASARRILATGTAVELVVSDVVLPGGTSGPEFAEAARTEFPGLRFIFMSGYPAEAAQRNSLLGPDSILLNKPFRRQQLAEVLQQELSPNP